MKIGIDISQIVYKGGVATYTQNLITSLLEIDKKNEYVLFGSSFGQYGKLISYLNDIKNRNVEKKYFPIPLSMIELLTNVLHNVAIESWVGPLDVFHSSDWVQFPSRAKKITTIHDLVIYQKAAQTPKKIIEVHKRRLKWVKKECDVIIADSQSTKHDIMQHLNIPDNKINVVYLGVDRQFVPQSVQPIKETKEKYGIGSDYILVFGAPGFRKNVAGLVKAFQMLPNEISHTLVIIGKSDEVDIQDNKRILNIDTVPFSHLPALYSGTSCFVYPSLYEGFGLPILEAMACGCMVVSSDRGSLKEIMITDNFLVDPEDIHDIAKNITAALKLSQNAREKRIENGIAHAKKFTWEKCARQTLNIYEKVGGA